MAKEKKTVIVVDDNPVTQQLMKKLLTNDNYDVIQCYSGASLIEAVRTKIPNAILMDVILPDGNGIDFVKQLKNISINQIAIIFTTNTVDPKNDKGFETLEVEGEKYRAFAKPLHHGKLLSTLKKEINRALHGGEKPKKLLEDNKGSVLVLSMILFICAGLLFIYLIIKKDSDAVNNNLIYKTKPITEIAK